MMTEETLTKLRWIEKYSFDVEFDIEDIMNLVIDEVEPIGDNKGPSPVRTLSVAVGHCLSSSLLYCLKKSRVKIKELETLVKLSTERNIEGRLRVKKIDVNFNLDVEERDKPKLERCEKIFEEYCTVTQSIRKGIAINVNIV
jgi:uncharacterized OsmC-like protein